MDSTAVELDMDMINGWKSSYVNAQKNSQLRKRRKLIQVQEAMPRAASRLPEAPRHAAVGGMAYAAEQRKKRRKQDKTCASDYMSMSGAAAFCNASRLVAKSTVGGI